MKRSAVPPPFAGPLCHSTAPAESLKGPTLESAELHVSGSALMKPAATGACPDGFGRGSGDDADLSDLLMALAPQFRVFGVGLDQVTGVPECLTESRSAI